ncbi:MAG: hypothetical protein MK089_04070 [Phycisphaerales bacterium]|nr:hypothetical protein [Phycisphaerales bacterium]
MDSLVARQARQGIWIADALLLTQAHLRHSPEVVACQMNLHADTPRIRINQQPLHEGDQLTGTDLQRH